MTWATRKAKLAVARFRPRGGSPNWDAHSCADSSKAPEEDDDTVSEDDHRSSKTRASKSGDDDRTRARAQQPWRYSFMIRHPGETLRMAFGKPTEEEHEAIMQFWLEH